MKICAASYATLAVLTVAALPASAAPSFSCKMAETSVEKAICADAELSAVDAGLADAYRDALRRLAPDPTLTAALKHEQAALIARRASTLEHPDGSLFRYMQSQLQWLTAIDEPRAGFIGASINGSGAVEVRPRAEAGEYSVLANGDDPVRGSYTCKFIGIGRREAEGLKVTWDTTENTDDGADGWTLELALEGSLLQLHQHRNDSEAKTPPFCGVHGSLEGMYLPARSEAPVHAWQPAQRR